jgi:tRNA-dihydrouridine synthase A
VQSGRFGACLMAEPDTVARGVEAMRSAVKVPVTVKCRIGIDDQDAEEDFTRFIDFGCQGRLRDLHRACPQGVAAGPQPEGEPGHPAARP